MAHIVFDSYDKASMFCDYARDTENMEYDLHEAGNRWRCVSRDAYDPQVHRAVVRNFRDDWRAAGLTG